MQLPSVAVATRRPVLVPEVVIPLRRPEEGRAVAQRRPRDEARREPGTRWLRPMRGLLVDVYA